MDKQKRLKQLETLENEPNLVFFNQIVDLNDKLRALNASVEAQNSKEVITYQNELKTLVDGLQSLTRSVIDKDTIVNIPLDQLASQIKAVEAAIKGIKEVKIPEFPSEIALDELQVNELLFAIQSLPQFPIDELKKMVEGLGKRIEAIKLEVPKNEFDYDFLDGKFDKLIKAVKGISISVSGGGGNVNTSKLATEETLQSIIDNQYVSSNIDTEDATNYYFLSFIPGTTKWRINRLNKTTYVSDYAVGNSDIDTAWTDRTTQTYLTTY